MRRLMLDRTWLLLGLALAAGLLAAWSARQHLQQRVAQIEARGRMPMVQRLVAAYDLPAGTRLQAEHVAVRDIPGQYAAADTLAPERYGEIDGGMLDRPVRRGDPILPGHVARPSEPALSARLAEGRRAVTIPVDEINSLSGMLEPGDLIDLYVSFEHRRRRVTAPLLQGVLVLATGPRTLSGGQGGEAGGAAAAGYSAITLDTSPQDAVKLVAARQAGTLTAMLRHPRDTRSSGTAARGDLAALLGMQGQRRPPRRDRGVPVIYGDRPMARIPDLAAGAAEPEPEPDGAALFQVPAPEEVASAWMAWMQAARAGAHASAGEEP